MRCWGHGRRERGFLGGGGGGGPKKKKKPPKPPPRPGLEGVWGCGAGDTDAGSGDLGGLSEAAP